MLNRKTIRFPQSPFIALIDRVFKIRQQGSGVCRKYIQAGNYCSPKLGRFKIGSCNLLLKVYETGVNSSFIRKIVFIINGGPFLGLFTWSDLTQGKMSSHLAETSSKCANNSYYHLALNKQKVASACRVPRLAGSSRRETWQAGIARQHVNEARCNRTGKLGMPRYSGMLEQLAPCKEALNLYGRDSVSVASEYKSDKRYPSSQM